MLAMASATTTSTASADPANPHPHHSVVHQPAKSPPAPKPLNKAKTTSRTTTTPFSRQLAGLANDAGVMAFSLANNVAARAAHDIGRKTLFGVPYNALTLVAHMAGDISKVLNGTPLGATSTGRFKVDYGVFNVLGYLTPWRSPPGADDPSITVTDAHPLPIILLNGTANTQSLNWSVGAPVLANAGYKVYAFNYGNITASAGFPVQAIGGIAASARQLSDKVEQVLAETGAAKVILIGHSQGGGILPEYYLNNLGGAAKVSQLIGIAPSNHGTTISGLASALSIPVLGVLLSGLMNVVCPACLQQTVGSSLVQHIYGNGDTRSGVTYGTIISMDDEVVTPYTRQALSGPNVTNIILQQQDPELTVGHGTIVVNYQVWQDVLAMLAA